MKLVIGGIKGGGGKTTLATNLAYMRSANGKKVLLVDADEQKSASAWSDQRIGMKYNTNWTTIQLSGMYLYSEIQKLEKDYEDIIVDTGGRDNSSQRSALTIADVFLMPFRPEAYDIWTLGQVKRLLCEVVATNPNLKALAILNQSESKSQSNTEEAKELLLECKELSCLPFNIGSRKSFGKAAAQGLSVMEIESDKWTQKAQMEMQQLYDTIYTKYT